MIKNVCWVIGRRFIDTHLFSARRGTNFVQHVKISVSTSLRGGHERTFQLTPSRWQWHKFKDMFHFYAMVGLIPVGAIIFYTNVYIGPATLCPTPPDYCPKHWEYYQHPITRFMARYVRNNPQQEYEKFLHFIDEEKQKIKMRELEKAVINKIAERHDYEAFYYRPIYNKYLRINKQTGEELFLMGDDFDGGSDSE